MPERPTDVPGLCMDVTAQIMVALIESGKLPANDSEAVGKYYAELYKWIYGARLGKTPSSPKQ